MSPRDPRFLNLRDGGNVPEDYRNYRSAIYWVAVIFIAACIALPLLVRFL